MPLSTGTAIGIAIALWFATGWYLNERLAKLHQKFDALFEQLNGLREYLYEIDPQFDEERQALESFMSGSGGLMAGAAHNELMRERHEAGRRTLNTGFSGSER
ncbi:MAG: hypothetical protein ACKOQM_14360 [Novosphingobium sp.]